VSSGVNRLRSELCCLQLSRVSCVRGDRIVADDADPRVRATSGVLSHPAPDAEFLAASAVVRGLYQTRQRGVCPGAV
jgi:hypothetical protein